MKSYLILQNCRSFYHFWVINGIPSGEVKAPSFTQMEFKILLYKLNNYAVDWTKHSDILPILLFSTFPSTTFSECCSSDLLRLTWLKKIQQIFIIIYTKKESFQFIIAENKCNSKKSKFSLLHGIYFRAYCILNLCRVQLSHPI